MSETPRLIFICTKCHSRVDAKTASSGCGICTSKLFRVARDGNAPIMNNPLYDPYRQHDSEDDGYEKNTPGDENGMGNTGFGRRFRDETPSGSLPVVDDYMTGTEDSGSDSVMNQDGDSYLQSPAMTADDSPFNPINNKEPLHIGPFNMHKSPNINNNRRDVFERIQKSRKGNYAN